MKKINLILLLIILILGYIATQNLLTVMSATPPIPAQPNKVKVGLLVEGKIIEQTWESQAYKGLRKIRDTYNAQVDYKEQMNTEEKRINGVEDFAKKGYNLIIGNGAVFQQAFNKVAPKYPNTKFVFFYANPKGKNVTSFYFNAKSLGYFSGMIAGLSTKNHRIGVIPAFDNLDEIPYFIQGAKDQDPHNEVFVQTVHSWDDNVKAGKITDDLLKQNVDILAPMGDGYNLEVTMRAWKAHVPVIGYITDHSSLAKDTVLITGEQHLSDAYIKIADAYFHHKLNSGKFTLDFNNGGESFTAFNQKVPKYIKDKVNHKIQEYNEGKFILPTLALKYN